MYPKISIITICYNIVNDIEKTLKSVISQTYPNIEYIVIDGGSKDYTVDIIRKYSDNITYWVSESDKGIYDAMNKAINKASGEWINFMNGGDCFLDENTLLSVGFENLLGFDVICGNHVIPKRGGLYLLKAKPFFMDTSVRYNMGFNHQATFVRTYVAKAHPFNLKYKIAADYDMIKWFAKNGCKFKYVNVPIAYCDVTGISSRKKIQHMQEIRLIDGVKQTRTSMISIYKKRYFALLKKNIANIIFKFFPEIVKKQQLKDGSSLYEKSVPFL